MTSYQHLMSIFLEAPKAVSIPKATHFLKARKSGLYYTDAEVHNKSGEAALLRDVIEAFNVTVVFFGSPHYSESDALLDRLKSLYERSKETDRLIGVVYAPLFTFKESELQVKNDFRLNHGDWWMLDFKSWDVVEAALLHGLTTLPALLVVDQKGAVITDCGQLDLALLGNDVLITWF